MYFFHFLSILSMTTSVWQARASTIAAVHSKDGHEVGPMAMVATWVLKPQGKKVHKGTVDAQEKKDYWFNSL